MIPVAILSSDGFDARVVDPRSVSMAGACVALKPQGAPIFGFEDVNSDGLLDIVVLLSADQLQVTAGDQELTLQGKTFSGIPISGADTVRVIE